MEKIFIVFVLLNLVACRHKDDKRGTEVEKKPIISSPVHVEKCDGKLPLGDSAVVTAKDVFRFAVECNLSEDEIEAKIEAQGPA